MHSGKNIIILQYACHGENPYPHGGTDWEKGEGYGATVGMYIHANLYKHTVTLDP